jgi:hypothetical protein
VKGSSGNPTITPLRGVSTGLERGALFSLTLAKRLQKLFFDEKGLRILPEPTDREIQMVGKRNFSLD